MRKKTKKALLNITVAVALLFGASYLSKLYLDRIEVIEGDKVDINTVNNFTFTEINKKITFYQEAHKQILWGFNYDSLPVYETLGFIEMNKQPTFIEITLKNVYYLPLQLVATDLTGNYVKTVDLNVKYVESLTIDESEVLL